MLRSERDVDQIALPCIVLSGMLTLLALWIFGW
jgi:hypothetical protein